jgi:hypothetical protein
MLGAMRRQHKLSVAVLHRVDAVEVHRVDAVEGWPVGWMGHRRICRGG